MQINPQSAPQPNRNATSQFLADLQFCLACHIGPIAPLLIEDAIEETPGVTSMQLIKRLSNEIPDTIVAGRFLCSAIYQLLENEEITAMVTPD